MRSPRLIFANDRTVTGTDRDRDMEDDCKVSTAHVATAASAVQAKPKASAPGAGAARNYYARPYFLACRDFSNLDYLPFKAQREGDFSHQAVSLRTPPHAGISSKRNHTRCTGEPPALLQLFPKVG